MRNDGSMKADTNSITRSPVSACGQRNAVSLADPTGETSAVTWSVPALTPARAWRALSRTFAAEAAGRQSDYVKMMVDGALIFDRESWPTAGSDSDDLTAWLGRV